MRVPATAAYRGGLVAGRQGQLTPSELLSTVRDLLHVIACRTPMRAG